MYNEINALKGVIKTPKPKDIANTKFGKLVALEIVGKNKHNKFLWLCQCDCGNTKIVPTNALTSGNTRSCGCLHLEKLIKRNTMHNMSKTRLFGIWQAMKKRCYDIKSKAYKNYGHRGIKVCGEWIEDFKCFRNWAIANGYREDLSIDRKDVNGDYCPENCRWISLREQTRNKRESIYLTINGVTKLLIDVAEENQLSAKLLRQRYHRGITGEEILMPPKDSKFRKGHPRYGGRNKKT